MNAFAFPAEFLRSQGITGKWEGGWSDHPADPGGKTMYGVTEKRWHEFQDAHGRPRTPVRSITKEDALEVFFEGYWQKLDCGRLFPGVNLAVYDAAVNSGPARAKGWLAKSLDKTNDHAQTVRNICQRRLSTLQGFATWKTFGRGWGNRIADVQASGVAWALAAAGLAPATAERILLNDAKDRDRAASAQTSGGAVAGAGATGSAVGSGPASTPTPTPTDPLAIDPTGFPVGSVLLVAAIGLALLAAYLLWRSRLNAMQAKAFRKAADQVSYSND